MRIDKYYTAGILLEQVCLPTIARRGERFPRERQTWQIEMAGEINTDYTVRVLLPLVSKSAIMDGLVKSLVSA